MISTSVASLGGAILNAIASVAFGIFIGQKGFDFWFCAIKVLGGVARDSPDCTMFWPGYAVISSACGRKWPKWLWYAPHFDLLCTLDSQL